MPEAEDLEHLADRLDGIAGQSRAEPFKGNLERLKAAAEKVAAASSGSWIGYHANVYYHDLEPPAPGDHFSPEWGLMNIGAYDASTGWEEYSEEYVKATIFRLAGDPSLSAHDEVAARAKACFLDGREEVLSILESVQQRKRDSFIERLQEEARSLKAFSAQDFVRSEAPSGLWSPDSTAMTQGLWTPPHIGVLAKTFSLEQSFRACEALARLSRRAAAHVRRRDRRAIREDHVGTHIFIGHGRSDAWRSLKDFVQDRLKLPWDEFNRLPVAGVTNISRLSEMLDAAAIALIVMTAEDEQVDGKIRARENVVHEAGLFQGRLGFTRAILLLEDGCEEFSNIHGLGQIRFAGKIDQAFEEVRRVLEREGLIPEADSEA